MKDTELHARIAALGLAPNAAGEMAAHIRDTVHPVAVLAVTKAADHLTGLSLYDAGVGLAGMDEYGYYYDGTAGLFKKIGKAVKSVAKTAVKVVKKVALPVAAIVAAPVTGGASVAAYGAIKGAQIGKKTSKAANAAAIAQTNAMITGKPVSSKAEIAAAVSKTKKDNAAALAAVKAENAAALAAAKAENDALILARTKMENDAALAKVKAENDLILAQTQAGKDAATRAAAEPATSVKLARGGKVRVPRDLSKKSDALAKQVVESGAPLDTAALMQSLLSQQSGGGGGGGGAFSSPAGQAIVSDVAAQGVEATPAGPAGLPKWAIPAGLAALGLVAVVALSRSK